MPTSAQQAASPLSSLIDLNFITINRIFILVVTLIFFTTVIIIRRKRGLDIPARITTPIKLSLLGFLLLCGEIALNAVPSYRAMMEAFQTIVVMLCLAKLSIYLIVDIYLRLQIREEVPSFLRDAVRLVVYLSVTMLSLRLVLKIDVSAIITTTTVITAVIAFAMQNTLANALAGFSIQTDRLLRRQNWVSLKEKNIFGEIVNIGFRYTTLRCLDNTLAMVPNSIIMQNVLTFYGNTESDEKPSLVLDVMLDYNTPPERSKELLLNVLLHVPLVLAVPGPLVRLLAFSDSGITYRLVFSINDLALKGLVQDQIYTQVWYAVNREGSSFPYPHREIVTAQLKPPFEFSRSSVATKLRQTELFAMLDEAHIASLAEQIPVSVFGPGEVIVKQGDSSSSLFMVLKGDLDVSLDDVVIGTISEDSFFGEMSLLTGELRRATVRANREVWLAEVTKELMEPLLRANPDVMEMLSGILADREQRTGASISGEKGKVAKATRRDDYLQKLKQFFRL